jgi:hypothetical protein
MLYARRCDGCGTIRSLSSPAGIPPAPSPSRVPFGACCWRSAFGRLCPRPSPPAPLAGRPKRADIAATSTPHRAARLHTGSSQCMTLYHHHSRRHARFGGRGTLHAPARAVNAPVHFIDFRWSIGWRRGLPAGHCDTTTPTNTHNFVPRCQAINICPGGRLHGGGGGSRRPPAQRHGGTPHTTRAQHHYNAQHN